MVNTAVHRYDDQTQVALSLQSDLLEIESYPIPLYDSGIKGTTWMPFFARTLKTQLAPHQMTQKGAQG